MAKSSLIIEISIIQTFMETQPRRIQPFISIQTQRKVKKKFEKIKQNIRRRYLVRISGRVVNSVENLIKSVTKITIKAEAT